ATRWLSQTLSNSVWGMIVSARKFGSRSARCIIICAHLGRVAWRRQAQPFNRVSGLTVQSRGRSVAARPARAVFRLTPPFDCPAWTRSQRTTTWTRYGVGEAHEVPLVSFDAVSVPAGGLQAALFIGMGRSPRCRAL